MHYYVRYWLCIRYIKPLLIYKLLILDTYHPDICMNVNSENAWSFFEASRGLRVEGLGNTDLNIFACYHSYSTAPSTTIFLPLKYNIRTLPPQANVTTMTCP